MIPFYTEPVPYITTEQMREVDRLMIETYRIDLIQMMENAGRNLAVLARERFFGSSSYARRVVVLAGTGGNGGGALVSARWLHNAGAKVTVLVTAPRERFSTVPGHQLDILHSMGVPVLLAERMQEVTKPDLTIDGLIGYSLKGAPHGATGQLIEWASADGSPILSLDTPSGLDTTTGTIFEPVISAAATMTLALPKQGLKGTGNQRFVGELYLANISVPLELYAQPSLGLRVGHVFAQSDIVRLW